MNKIRVLGLIGGISKNSLNKKLFNAFKEETPDGFELYDFKIEDLPFFNQDLEEDVPKIVKDFREKVTEADAILFITPEYNRSIPAVLKNAIDWASRPYGESVWDQKTAAVAGASMGNIGTFGAQHHLRQCLSYLNMRTMGQPEFYMNASKSFDKSGKLIDEKSRELIQKFWNSFKEWVQFNQKESGMPIAFTTGKRRIFMAQRSQSKSASSNRSGASKAEKESVSSSSSSRSSGKGRPATSARNSKMSQMNERSSK